jgi:tetratricopeptide (TPR) repeat protein
MGRFTQAIADYDAAIAQNSRFAGALYGRGIARLQQGDAEGAVADMDAAKSIDPAIEQAFARYGLQG